MIVVKKKFNDHRDARELLQLLVNRVNLVMLHIKSYKLENPLIVKMCKLFDERFMGVRETVGDGGHTSYVLNKTNLILCLRDRHGNLHDMNTLTYVALHEIAHMVTDEVGHTKMYWTLFKFLKQEAMKIDLLKPLTGNVEYCGHTRM